MRNIAGEEHVLVEQVINTMILLWVFLSTFALWFSLMRTELIGWTARENLHITFYICILIVGALRNRIKPYIKAILFVTFQALIAMVALLSFGTMAPAVFFFPLIIVILALFFHHNVVMFITILVLCFVAAVGFGFQTGYLTLTTAASALFISSEHWFLYLVSFSIMMLFIAISITKYRTRVHNLFIEVNQQKVAIDHLVDHDSLTGMALIELMITKYDEKLPQLEGSQTIALIYINLDRFKLVNDCYGHDAGDICLIHTANKIFQNIDDEDFACRLGGDEFLILMMGDQGKKEVQSQAKIILDAISEPFLFKGQKITINASMGIAFYPTDGTKFSELKRMSDWAMYQAQKSKTESICIADLKSISS